MPTDKMLAAADECEGLRLRVLARLRGDGCAFRGIWGVLCEKNCQEKNSQGLCLLGMLLGVVVLQERGPSAPPLACCSRVRSTLGGCGA